MNQGEMTAREQDVVVIARHLIFQLPENRGKSVEFGPEIVETVLGTIVLLADRLEGRAPLGVEGPKEYCEIILKQIQEAERLAGLADG